MKKVIKNTKMSKHEIRFDKKDDFSSDDIERISTQITNEIESKEIKDEIVERTMFVIDKLNEKQSCIMGYNDKFVFPIIISVLTIVKEFLTENSFIINDDFDVKFHINNKEKRILPYNKGGIMNQIEIKILNLEKWNTIKHSLTENFIESIYNKIIKGDFINEQYKLVDF